MNQKNTQETSDLNWTAAAMAEFVKSKTGRKLPLSAARELLSIAHKAQSWNHLRAQSNKDVKTSDSSQTVPSQYNGVDSRILGMINSDHVSEDVASGTVFKGTDAQWRLYSNETTSATYYLGDDAKQFKEDCADFLNEHDLKVFLTLMKKGFVEVRFDEDASISDELPMRPGLLDTENYRSFALRNEANGLAREKELKSSNQDQTKLTLYACHCDLNPGETPDTCVIDAGRSDDCALASIHRDNPNWKHQCEHWKPVSTTVRQASANGLYGCKCNMVTGQTPDACVIHTGNPKSCSKAAAILAQGKAQHTCDQWVAVSVLFPNLATKTAASV